MTRWILALGLVSLSRWPLIEGSPPEVADLAPMRSLPAPFAPVSETLDIDVLTLNVWGLPAPIQRDVTRFADIAARLRDYDIVGIQEAFTPEAREPLRAAGFAHQHLGQLGTLPWRRLGNGLAVLSRWPIEETAEMFYEGCSGTDCLAHKGALYARVRVSDNTSLHVFNTHLQSGAERDDTRPVRERQVEMLADFVRAHDDGGPMLFLGDFNTLADGDEYVRLLQRLDAHDGWLSAASAYPPRGDTMGRHNTWTRDGRDQRIDYVLYRDGLQRRFAVNRAAVTFDEPVRGRNLSDHFGLGARLRLSTAP